MEWVFSDYFYLFVIYRFPASKRNWWWPAIKKKKKPHLWWGWHVASVPLLQCPCPYLRPGVLPTPLNRPSASSVPRKAILGTAARITLLKHTLIILPSCFGVISTCMASCLRHKLHFFIFSMSWWRSDLGGVLISNATSWFSSPKTLIW